jgi:hypothetical protein
VLEISNKGRYSLTLEQWNGGDTPFGSIPEASGSVRTRATNHLVLKCTQSPQVNGGIQTVSGTVNGKKVGVQRVSERGDPYLSNPQVGLHVGGVGLVPAVPTTASFSNLKVTQVRVPAKTPLDWSDPSAPPIGYLFDKFYRSCSGFPVTPSAPYEGDTHPLVISAYGLAMDNAFGFSATRPAWAQPPFAEDFQLVACVEKTQDTVGPSCGTYTRDDGVTGELRRTSYDVSIRIVVAADGREIAQSTLTGPFPDCPSQTTVAGNPPWTMQGRAGIEEVVQYVTGFTAGPPR